jgi:hypothetical protein
MTGVVSRCSGWLLNRIRVNQVRPAMRDGVRVYIKQRRIGGTLLVWFGNRLLAWADGRMYMFLRVEDWLRWETQCMALLYPHQPAVRAERDRSLVIPALDGISLRVMLDHGNEAVEQAFVLAAREVRRVHGLTSTGYHAPWSHGDLHLDNILCDLSTGRASLIDFDIRHPAAMAPLPRQADDLKAVLLELIGRPDERWRVLASTFITEYGECAVLDELSRQLVVPRGFARVLFHIKTNGAPLSRVRPRLEALRQLIQQVIEVTR